MPLTPEQQDLREAAKQATPGPWHISEPSQQLHPVRAKDCIVADVGFSGSLDKDAKNAAYLAAANPAAILAILDQLDGCNEDYGCAVDSVAQLQDEVFEVRAQLEAALVAPAPLQFCFDGGPPMAVYTPPRLEQDWDAPVADCGPNPVTWTAADEHRLDTALHKTFGTPLPAAPSVLALPPSRTKSASQREAIIEARARLESKWDAEGDCGSCAWHACLYEHGVDDEDIAYALERNNGVLELVCVSKDADEPSSHRGVKINIGQELVEATAAPSSDGSGEQGAFEAHIANKYPNMSLEFWTRFDGVIVYKDAMVQGRWAGWTARALQPAQPDTDKLLAIIASAYQIAGAHDAPEHILDVLADPEAATVEQVEAMLPYQAERDADARLNWMLEWYLREGKRAEFNPHGHITFTTKEMMIAAIDAALSGAPADRDERKE